MDITICPRGDATPNPINTEGDTTWYYTDAVAVDDAGKIIGDDLAIISQAYYHDYDGSWTVGPDDGGGAEVEGLLDLADTLELDLQDLDIDVEHPDIPEPDEPPTIPEGDEDNDSDWLVISWAGVPSREQIVGRYATEDHADQVARAAARDRHHSGGDNAYYGSYAVSAADYYDPPEAEPSPDGWVVIVGIEDDDHYPDSVAYYDTEPEAERAAAARRKEDEEAPVEIREAADYWYDDAEDD